MLELWNERIPKIEEERHYQFLTQLHQLTQMWMNDLMEEPEPYHIKRFVPPQFEQNIWILEKLKLDTLPPDLATLIGGDQVSAFLEELENTLWTVQEAVLSAALRTGSAEEVFNRLEQSTWNYGKTLAHQAWGTSRRLDATHVESFWPNPFSFHTPFMELATQNHSPERTSLQFLWFDHPRSRAIINRSPLIESLTQLHQQGFSGWVYGCNPTLKVQFCASSLQQLDLKLQPSVSPLQVEVSTLDFNRR